MQTNQRINKSLFAAGMQCAKRLYLECHRADEIPKPTVGRQSLLDAGERLLALACQGFPNGRTVDADDTVKAGEQTREILTQGEGAAIFNAAFAVEHTEVRCDIVLPTGSGQLDIFEVKSGTKVKPRHVQDFALQVHVIEACGYTVRNASIVHLSPEYLHDGSKDLPANTLFKNVDVSAKVRKRVAAARANLDNYLTVLTDETTVELPMGTWCVAPIPCHFLEKCRGEASAHPLLELPDLTKKRESELEQEGRQEIIRLLWQVALADNHLDNFEVNVISKVAGLLGVSRRDSIAIKHEIQSRHGSGRRGRGVFSAGAGRRYHRWADIDHGSERPHAPRRSGGTGNRSAVAGQPSNQW